MRNANVVTVRGAQRCDIGIADGLIAALSAGLPKAEREIDARGRNLLPCVVDGHCHLDQPMPAPMRMDDDF